MQMDFHYHGVYCLARMAGLSAESARVIASASQYVDDSINDQAVSTDDGNWIVPPDQLHPVTTAHHMASQANLDLDDQRWVWVPFHFLPGGVGDSYTERLVCAKDGALARDMLQHYLTKLDAPYGRELVGLAGHVYADTFAHYGFSGVSSRRNRIVADTLKCEYGSPDDNKSFLAVLGSFFRRYGEQGGLIDNYRARVIGSIAEIVSGALGHGAAATFPDRPYLQWSFEYEHANLIGARARRDAKRNNPANYYEACQKLWAFFRQAGQTRPDWADGPVVSIDDKKEEIESIIATRAEKEDRAQAWAEALGAGSLTGSPETMPLYLGPAWTREIKTFPNMNKPVTPNELNVYRFFQAASYHQHYVLRELLPERGVLVV